MSNRRVPRSEWARFFDDFSRQHEGQRVAVLVLDPRFGSQIEAENLPFEGIVAPLEEGPISIHVGSRPERHVEHEIPHPREVWLKRNDDGVEQALDVESTDGTRTILEFLAARGASVRVAAPPRRGLTDG